MTDTELSKIEILAKENLSFLADNYFNGGPAVIGKKRVEDCYSLIKENLPFLIKVDRKFLDLHNILSFMVENSDLFLFRLK